MASPGGTFLVGLLYCFLEDEPPVLGTQKQVEREQTLAIPNDPSSDVFFFRE